ncbi:glycoside hydrolase family 18 protein [Mycoplasmatota bacterium]|nr:glycoside hydrolase family 18 protein [Mycoplasmatota bacterium]
MQIHVVKPGETLNSIAKEYNTTPNVIIEANKIPHPYTLAVGQALVIPIDGSFYYVKPGDTLFKIAQLYGLNYQQLVNSYGILPNQMLTEGQKIYIPPLPKREAEINAYIEPFGDEVNPKLILAAQEAAPNLTYLAPFSFQILRDGTLKAPLLNDFANIAKDNRAVLMMVISNLENGQFSAELGKIILNDEALQDKLLDNIIKTAKELGFKDIHFDMEFLPPEEKDNYLKFLRKAKQRLSEEGFLMSVALAPKISGEQKGPWYEAHDYQGIGEIADFVIPMTYEWGYSGGPPRAVSPIDEVTKVVDYAVSVIPPSKILLGQNLYGYDWTLPYVPGGEYAKAISPQQAIELAKTYQVPIEYDIKSQAPYFNYTDEEGKEHTVWFEDARSIQAKFDLVKKYGLRGVSYWKLGLPFPQNWLLIEDNFNVIKNI